MTHYTIKPLVWERPKSGIYWPAHYSAKTICATYTVVQCERGWLAEWFYTKCDGVSIMCQTEQEAKEACWQDWLSRIKPALIEVGPCLLMHPNNEPDKKDASEANEV